MHSKYDKIKVSIQNYMNTFQQATGVSNNLDSNYHVQTLLILLHWYLKVITITG